MDNQIKNIDEIGGVNEHRCKSMQSLALETEGRMCPVHDDGIVGFTPSTSNEDKK